jgi:hypothetical protein
VLRQVFGMLPHLSELSVTGVSWMNDSTFHDAPGLPHFPALETLRLEKVHGVTAEGLAVYLSSPMCANRLRTLIIKDCSGIEASSLHLLLQAATSLKTLEYTTVVTAALPLDPIPPMASFTLHKLNFEIISTSSNQLYPPGASYYQYLARSLINNCLPALRQLYVRDPEFPDVLTLAPPIRPFSEEPPPMFNQPLDIYAKGSDELEWIFTSILPPEAHGRRLSVSVGRPVSSYSAHKGLGAQWGGEARQSVVVPNGFGGFLAVPAEQARPRSAGGYMAPSGGFGHSHSQSVGGQSFGGNPSPRASWMSHAGREKRASRADLWR